MSEFAKNIAANATWDGIKKGGLVLSLVGLGAAYAIWEEFHSVTLMIGGALWFILVVLTIPALGLCLKDRLWPKKAIQGKESNLVSQLHHKAVFYQGRHPRPDLRELVSRGGPVWIATHVAGRLCNEELLKKPVERLILQNPDSISIDLLAAVIPDRSAEQLRNQVKLACEVAKQNGVELRLFDGQMTSIIIGDALSSGRGWAQIEAFLPWTAANDRPSILFYQQDYPDSFSALVRMFNEMWVNPIAPTAQRQPESDGSRIEEPIVEDFPAHDALNLRITNRHHKLGLSKSQLTLHSARKWDNGRRQFSQNVFDELPMVLYSDHLDLPYKEPRMFQLLQFTDKSKPTVEGKPHDKKVLVTLPDRGIWKFSMELRWGGSSMAIVRYFQWSEGSLPTFCKDPS